MRKRDFIYMLDSTIAISAAIAPSPNRGQLVIAKNLEQALLVAHSSGSTGTSTPAALQGYGKGWGQASEFVQRQVMAFILESAEALAPADSLLLLVIARFESGFNPSAKNPQSSAGGVFQLTKATAKALGLTGQARFDAAQNIAAGLRLFAEHSALITRKYGELGLIDRASLLYALHHDGPVLNAGGLAIAHQKVIPLYQQLLKTAGLAA
jgi:hypothetical protein